jgi:RimJ/RimL family protein N-acetyltransferase
MTPLRGNLVALYEPFPVLTSWASLYEWLHGCDTICESPAFPKDREEFRSIIAEGLRGMRSWGVYRIDTDALIGTLIFEPLGTMGGKTYVASRRAAWGRGYMDEAGRLAIDEVFTRDPNLSYILGMVVANNAPARSYNERLGLRLKNVIPNYTVSVGKPRDMLMYEMTREAWEATKVNT